MPQIYKALLIGLDETALLVVDIDRDFIFLVLRLIYQRRNEEGMTMVPVLHDLYQRSLQLCFPY